MDIQFLKNIFQEFKNEQAIIWKGADYNYDWLITDIDYWECEFNNHELKSGDVVVVDADFSPKSVSLFLALIQINAIIIPVTFSKKTIKEKTLEVSKAEVIISIDSEDQVSIEKTHPVADHDLYQVIRDRKTPGLVLFSSGTTGEPKAIVHDLAPILEKFKIRKKRLRSITFLLFDHIGGINTLFYLLSNGGCIVTIDDRDADNVCRLIEKYKVDMLPTSPTFLNMILFSQAYDRHDLSSLSLVTYGTEPMPAQTLKKFHSLFPEVKLQQTYGLSELGVMRSKSKSSDSLWVKVGGEGFETRIVDNFLQIKAKSSMLGYLNAPSPYTEDGWFITGDRVEQDGEYIKILGRESDFINVGGEKVNPVEVESVILSHPSVDDTVVYSEKNYIVGSIVCAQVSLNKDAGNMKQILKDIKKHCRKYLADYKVPVKITVNNELQYNKRFKKKRTIVHETV